MPLFMFNTPTAIRTVLPFIPISTVVMEWQCPLTERRADLAILDAANEHLLLIEVFHTHEVDIEKRQDLSLYWWIDVKANQVPALRLRILTGILHNVTTASALAFMSAVSISFAALAKKTAKHCLC